MHIADGILPTAWCVAGHIVAIPAATLLARRIETSEIVRMGMISAVCFAVSLIHFPVGGTSIHLGLYGLAGLVLGWRAVPVIFANLLLQSLLFQHGGLLSLGVNTINMSAGALAGIAMRKAGPPDGLRSFAAGFIGVLVPASLMGVEFALAGYGKGFAFLGLIYSVAGLIEGFITSAIVSSLRKLKPQALPA